MEEYLNIDNNPLQPTDSESLWTWNHILETENAERGDIQGMIPIEELLDQVAFIPCDGLINIDEVIQGEILMVFSSVAFGK